MVKTKIKSGERTANPRKLKSKLSSGKRKKMSPRNQPTEQSAATSILSGPMKGLIRGAFLHRG
jgi:hypothetical protein